MSDETLKKAQEYLARITGISREEVMPYVRETAATLLNTQEGLSPSVAFTLERAASPSATTFATAFADDFALEAIISEKRPAELVHNGRFVFRDPDWTFLNSGSAHEILCAAMPSIGRVELPHHPSLPYGGTAFVVGPHLMMTNRHVAETFATGLGERDLRFYPGQTADVDFLREYQNASSILVKVREVAMIHPYWDMALLRVDGLPEEQQPLLLSQSTPEDLFQQPIAVIGYPAFDPRNDRGAQDRVFKGIYDVKRIQPGKVGAGKNTPRELIPSYGKQVSAMIHDASTLGGVSGSPVIDPFTGHVVGLHFAGVKYNANYVVPASELAKDARIVDAGVHFAEPARVVKDAYLREWQVADPQETVNTALAPEQKASATLSIPLTLTVRLGEVTEGTSIALASGVTTGDFQTEAMVEPIHEETYDNRKGYDPTFLGPVLPLPKVNDEASVARLENGEHVIPYHHFSLALHKARRLAVFTAANVDTTKAAKEPEPGRYNRKDLSGLGKNDSEKWFGDPRIPAMYQLPDVFFTKDRKAFDKGHLVRREDVAWGRSYAEVQAANGDTFHVTNCSPQVAGFNRANQEDNWGELEKFIIRQSKNSRISIFSGPVLSVTDRFFAGRDEKGAARVQIPARYWKIIAAMNGKTLEAYAFLLTQDLGNVELEFTVTPVWQQHLIAITDLERIIGLLTFPKELKAADQFRSAKGKAIVEATPVARIAREVAQARTEHDLARGPLTFRDPVLSAFQSIAMTVAREGQGGQEGMTEGFASGGPVNVKTVLDAEAVALASLGHEQDIQTEAMSIPAHLALCASLALQRVKASFAKDPQALAKLEDQMTMGQCDPKWASAIEVYLKTYGLSGDLSARHYVTPAKAGPSAIPVKAGARIGLVGDWGSGARPARRVLELMKQQKPDLLIHLGDIYYSGTEEECRDNFETIIDEVFDRKSTRMPVYSLCGNHDMYCGGKGYYSLIRRLNAGPLNQRASFFCLRAEDNSWQFLGMDTGRNDYNPVEISGVLTFVEKEEIAWLRARVAEFTGKTVLLSHHQLFSAFAGIGKEADDGTRLPYNPELLALYKTLKATGRSIPAWFWGHEHSQSIYKPYLDLPFGRCLGHGAIPVPEADNPYTPLEGISNLPTIMKGSKLTLRDGYYANGFAMLTLGTGQTITADYFEERNGKAVRVFQETIA